MNMLTFCPTACFWLNMHSVFWRGSLVHFSPRSEICAIALGSSRWGLCTTFPAVRDLLFTDAHNAQGPPNHFGAATELPRLYSCCSSVQLPRRKRKN